jgi:DNA-directed RNA polymerase specialized sigma24 family protein
MSATTSTGGFGADRPGHPSGRSLQRLASVWTSPVAQVAPSRDDAMRVLYERTHADMVRFAAFLCGDVHAAEDIAQEAFVQVFGTVVNTVRGRHRRRRVAERRDAPHLAVVASAEDDAMGRVGRDEVLAAVALLPLRQRACVVMRHWLRMTESEIAIDLGVSVGSVRTHIKRGTARLEERLGGLR